MFSLMIIIAAFIGVAALVGGVAVLFRGEQASSAEERLEGLLNVNPNRGDPTKADRSLLQEPLDDGPSFFEEYFAQLFDVRLMLEQAEIPLTPLKLLAMSGGLFMIGPAVCFVLQWYWWAALLIGLPLAMMPITYVWWVRSCRWAEFAKQLPEALELIGRALRAGHSLGAGMQLVSEEMTAPIGTEFRRAYDEQNLGVSLEQSLEDMAARIPNLDLKFFVTAVILQRTTGGDLAEILDKIGHLIRERFKILGMVQALTGEGRLSGIVLLALPPVLFITMLKLNPNYVMMLFNEDLGKQMLAVAIFLQLVGAYVIKQIVEIRV